MRNNENRFSAVKVPHTEDSTLNMMQEAQPKPFEFASPTEVVYLPSEGKYYGENHQFCNKSEIEIYYMSAKDEDILTSRRLLEKGIAFDKLIDNVLVQKVNSRTLLDADRSSILIAARRTGFGDEYETACSCPKCGNLVEVVADLNEDVTYNSEASSIDPSNIQQTQNNTFVYTLKRLSLDVEFRLMNGYDDTQLHNKNEKRKKKKLHESLYSDRLNQILVSLDGNENEALLRNFSLKVPLFDAKELLEAYKAVAPSVSIQAEYECNKCGSDGFLEVPITKDFFWPNQ